MLKYYAEGSMPNTLPVYVHTINIGNWKLVGFSRETTTSYGFDFVSSVMYDNIYGVQFHPEKSHKYGFKLLKNYMELT